MTKDELRRLLRNELDVVDDTRTGGTYVNFYATEADKKEHWQPAVSLVAEGRSLTVASSSCLPVRGWSAHADAYARAVCFLRRSKMSEDWRSTDMSAPVTERSPRDG